MKKILLLAFVAAMGMNLAKAQTTLNPGDIAITGFNMDNPDKFSFVLLVDVEAGTVINFTDNGWKSDGTWRNNEGHDTWTAASNMSAGTEIIVTCGVLSTNMKLSSSGDQIIAYQNASDMVAAVNNEGYTHSWQADATNASTSALPTGLTNGVNCVALIEKDNGVYDRTKGTTGSKDELLALINNYENWTMDNSAMPLSSAGFTLNAGGSVAVTGVSLNQTTLDIPQGNTATLVANVLPADATNTNVSWATSDASIATVSAAGVVTGIAPGTANITVTTADGGFTASCAVTVTSATIAVTAVNLNHTTLDVPQGSSATLTANVLPAGATNTNVSWTTDNATIATVSSTGVVTAVALGTANITVTTEDGGFTKTCAVTVSAATPPSVPVSNWAILLGVVGVIGFSLLRFVIRK